MKRFALAALYLVAIVLVLALRTPDGDHPSLVSRILATYTPSAPETDSPGRRAAAAQAFLASLDEQQREQCQLPLDDAERSAWTNVPPFGDQAGVRLGDLGEDALRRACDFLRACTSEQGWSKSRDILLADDRLLDGGRPRPGFGAENFWLVVFGEPSADGRWALQLDGHHLALNLTFAGSRVAMSPTFLGTQPAEFEHLGRKITPLAGEVAAAFALVQSLQGLQREQAVLSATRGRIVAGAGRDGHVPEPDGVAFADLDPAQRAHVTALLESFVGDLPTDAAAHRMEALAGELDHMHFAWSGPLADGSDVSWRLQGPSLILEYACQDLGGDPLAHLHSMYRDPTNEYGAGL